MFRKVSGVLDASSTITNSLLFDRPEAGNNNWTVDQPDYTFHLANFTRLSKISTPKKNVAAEGTNGKSEHPNSTPESSSERPEKSDFENLVDELENAANVVVIIHGWIDGIAETQYTIDGSSEYSFSGSLCER